MQRWPHCASGRRGNAHIRAPAGRAGRLAAGVERLWPQPSRAPVVRGRLGVELAIRRRVAALGGRHRPGGTDGLGLSWMPALEQRAGQGGRPWTPSRPGAADDDRSGRRASIREADPTTPMQPRSPAPAAHLSGRPASGAQQSACPGSGRETSSIRPSRLASSSKAWTGPRGSRRPPAAGGFAGDHRSRGDRPDPA